MFGQNKSTEKAQFTSTEVKGKSNVVLEQTRVDIEQGMLVEFIEDGMTVNKDASISFWFRLDLPALLRQTGRDLIEMVNQLAMSWQALPEGAVVQKVDVFTDVVFTAEESGDSYFLDRKQLYFKDRRIQLHQSYLSVIFPVTAASQADPRKTSFSQKGIMPNPLAGIEKRIDQAQLRVSQFETACNGLKDVRLMRMSASEIEQFMYQYFNLEFEYKKEAFEKSISNEKDGMRIGQDVVSCISLNEHGDVIEAKKKYERYGGVDMPFTTPIMHELGFPHIVVQTVEIVDTALELQKKQKLMSQINGIQGTLSGNRLNAQVQTEEMTNYITQVLADNERVVNYSSHVFVWDRVQKELDEKINQVLSGYRAMNGAVPIIESFDTSNLFYCSVPGSGHQVFRRKLLLAKQAAAYWGMNTGFKSERGLLLSDRNGSPIQFDAWVPHLQSRNVIVVGPTGSGKSFYTNNTAVQFVESGTLVDIIDVGGSYRGVSTVLNGNYFEYSQDKPIQFNPFLAEEGSKGYILDDAKKQLLVQLMATIWKDTARKEFMSKSETAIMTSLIEQFYSTAYTKNNKANSDKIALNFDSFFRFVREIAMDKNNPLQTNMVYCDLVNFCVVAEKFSKAGMYGYVLDSPLQTDLSESRFNVFDMAGVKEDPELFPIVVLLIMDVIMTRIKRRPDKRKVLIMDEAWSLLRGDMGEFMESQYRTIRKNNGSVWIVTQGVSEIVNSPIGKPIINNTAVKVVLNHSEAMSSIPDVVEHLGMDGHDESMIRALKKSRSGREFFVKVGTEPRVYMLEVSPEEFAAYSSVSEHRMKLKENFEKYNGNFRRALEETKRYIQQSQ